MPQYEFRVPDTPRKLPIELKNDDEAWSEAIVLCGEMLKDVDGKLPPGTTWDLSVCEGARAVATIKVEAHRNYDGAPASDEL